MTESFTREKNLVEQLVGPLGLDADGYGGPSVGGADTDADMLAAWRNGRVGIHAPVLDSGAVPGMTVPAEARTEKAVLAPDGGGRGMWGQNQLMDVSMVRPLVGSAREWAKP
jgi:hypothetical protein